MDGGLYIPTEIDFALVALTLEDLARMSAAARNRRSQRPRKRRARIVTPQSLWLPLGGEPLVLLMPAGACVNPPIMPVDAGREARARAQAEVWALENANMDDYGVAFLYALDLFRLGRKPRTDMLARRIRHGELGTGREVSALEFDDGTSVLDRVEMPITAFAASGDGDVAERHLGGSVTLAAIVRYAPRWGVYEGHGKDGDWRRPLEHAFYSARAGQLGFSGQLWTAHTLAVAA